MAQHMADRIDILLEMVQMILEGGKPGDHWKVSKEELMWEWSFDDIKKVIDAYDRAVDLSGFFMKLTQKTRENRNEKTQTGQES